MQTPKIEPRTPRRSAHKIQKTRPPKETIQVGSVSDVTNVGEGRYNSRPRNLFFHSAFRIIDYFWFASRGDGRLNCGSFPQWIPFWSASFMCLERRAECFVINPLFRCPCRKLISGGIFRLIRTSSKKEIHYDSDLLLQWSASAFLFRSITVTYISACS